MVSVAPSSRAGAHSLRAVYASISSSPVARVFRFECESLLNAALQCRRRLPLRWSRIDWVTFQSNAPDRPLQWQVVLLSLTPPHSAWSPTSWLASGLGVRSRTTRANPTRTTPPTSTTGSDSGIASRRKVGGPNTAPSAIPRATSRF